MNGYQRCTAGLGVHLSYPPGRLRSRKERKGHLATRHLQHLVRVLHSEHGRACKGWEGEWK